MTSKVIGDRIHLGLPERSPRFLALSPNSVRSTRGAIFCIYISDFRTSIKLNEMLWWRQKAPVRTKTWSKLGKVSQSMYKPPKCWIT